MPNSEHKINIFPFLNSPRNVNLTSGNCSEEASFPGLARVHLYILCITYRIQEYTSVGLQNLGVTEVNMESAV